MSGGETITAFHEDGTLYPVEKLEAHRRSIPHLAVSVFVFWNDRLLLQQRAETKYHAGGLWTNTCCSHPRWGEAAADCAHRRLREELGWDTPLTACGTIRYVAPVGELFENELVHCFGARLETPAPCDGFDPAEVKAVRYETLSDILGEQQANPAMFTPWFLIYMREYRDLIAGRMRVSANSR